MHKRSIHKACRRPALCHYGRSILPLAHKRTLFGLFEEKSQRDLREPMLDPGMGKMLQLDKRIHLIARYPPTEELSSAFNAFIAAKKKRKMPIEDFHATQLLQTLKVVEEESEKAQRAYLSLSDYYNAIFVISGTATEKLSAVHHELAWLVYEKWLAALSQQKKSSSKEEQYGRRSNQSDFLTRMVSILCRSGETARAQEMLEGLRDDPDADVADLTSRLWARLLDGYASEDNESKMLKILEQLEAGGGLNSANTYASLLMHYAQKNNVEETKRWATPRALELVSNASALTWYTNAEVRKELFAFCLRNHQMEWAQSVLRTKDGELDTEALFIGAASAGKPIEELDRMLHVLKERSADTSSWKPPISAINALLDLAISNNDPYTAERIAALAQRHRATFNAHTYIHQVRYRLLASDTPGALYSYALLRAQPITDNEDWSVMNLLTQHCTSDPKANPDTISGLAADLSDRALLFPAATVAGLASYHLRRDEYFELVDLLQTYAYQYSTNERIMLRDLLLSVCLDPRSDTARIWDTYMIFHQVFDLESDRLPRQNVMSVMFDRRRPDLATHVFTRMARHSRANTRPDHSTYVAAFIGIAKNEEPEALEVLHNMLKLDTEVEPSTQLRNSLMLAYSACGAHWRALEFWEEIAVSPEGPSYASLRAAFWACERSSWGFRTANTIWERLVASDVAIDVDLAGAYLGALSGNGLTAECFDVVKGLDKVIGGDLKEEEVASVVAKIFNAARGVVQQQDIEDWALERHPGVWEGLVKRGVDEDEMGLKQIVGFERDLVA